MITHIESRPTDTIRYFDQAPDSKEEEFGVDTSHFPPVSIKFDPGRLGVNLGFWSGGFNGGYTGMITDVERNGQAERLGVQLGWEITQIENEPYSEKLLDSYIRGKHPYVLTFKVTRKEVGVNLRKRSAPPSMMSYFTPPNLSDGEMRKFKPPKIDVGSTLRPSQISRRAKTPRGTRSRKCPIPVTKFGSNVYRQRKRNSVVMQRINIFETAAMKDSSSPKKSRRKKRQGNKVDKLTAKYISASHLEISSPKKKESDTNSPNDQLVTQADFYGD